MNCYVGFIASEFIYDVDNHLMRGILKSADTFLSYNYSLLIPRKVMNFSLGKGDKVLVYGKPFITDPSEPISIAVNTLIPVI